MPNTARHERPQPGDIKAALRAVRLRRRLTQDQVAEATGGKFKQAELSRFEAPGDRPTSRPVTHEVLLALEDAMDVPRGTVLAEAGYIDLRPVSAEEALRRDPFLSDDERAVFLQLYQQARIRLIAVSDEKRRPRQRNRLEHARVDEPDDSGDDNGGGNGDPEPVSVD